MNHHEKKMPRLVAELHAQFAESAKLEQAIKANLRGLDYGGRVQHQRAHRRDTGGFQRNGCVVFQPQRGAMR
jgi:cell division protein FtsB